jgi:hypothetical protein
MHFDETPAAFPIDGLAGDFEVFDFIGPLPRGSSPSNHTCVYIFIFGSVLNLKI